MKKLAVHKFKKVTRKAEIESKHPLTTTNKGGRPRLEEVVVLTDEMEAFARELRSGFQPEEAAERMGIPIEKALRYADNKAILQRVRVLYGDKLNLWALKRDALYEACLDAAIKVMMLETTPDPDYVKWWVERLEEQAKIQPAKEVKRIRQVEETSYPEAVESMGDLDIPKSIFRKRTIKTVEKIGNKPDEEGSSSG